MWRAVSRRQERGDWLTEPDESSLVEIALSKGRENKLNDDEDVRKERGRQTEPLWMREDSVMETRIRRHFELMARCLDWQKIFSNLLVLWD